MPLEPTPLHQSQIPRSADEPVQEAVNFATPSMGFGLPNSSEPTSYDGMYLTESTTSTLPGSSYSQTESFYQSHVPPDYFTPSHSEPQQVVM